MEAGYNFAVPQQRVVASQNKPSDLYDLTSYLSNALFSQDAESMNNMSAAISTSTGEAPTGFNLFKSVNAAQDAEHTLEHPYDILESLKAIPIYNEVLNYSKQEKLAMGQIQEGSQNASNNMTMLSSSPMQQEIPKNPRKRQANNFQYDSDFDNSGVGSGTDDQLKIKNSLTSCLNSDNSSTHSNEYQVNRKVSSKQNKKMNMVAPQFTQVMDFRGEPEQMMDMYQPVIIPEGMEGLIPHGYVQVKKESCAPRRTKKVTKCEHTNRKHYAKGMCSTCYHKAGRTKLAWDCEHKDRLHYAKGCCQDCYLLYHNKRRSGKKSKKVASADSQNISAAVIEAPLNQVSL